MIETQRTGQAVPLTPPVVAAPRAGILGLRARPRKRLRTGERIYLWASRVFVICFIVIILFPAVWVLGSSFQAGQIFNALSIFPTQFTFNHYYDLFTQTAFLTWVRNSLLVCTAVGAITVALVATMAYAFSRFRFPGRKYGLMTLLLIQMFPAQMSFVAFYFLLLKLGMLNTLYGLILVLIGGGIPFNAWLFKGYIDSLPRDLEEAAYVDGATKFQAYWKIILPLTRPMMAVIFLFTFIGVYSEFLLTSVIESSDNNYTVALGLQRFITNQFLQNWTEFAAAAVLGSLPLLIVFMLAQRHLVAGLARGAVKG
jgi:arabinogalactan oligomer/maltooligosaccharide transport system permease protein